MIWTEQINELNKEFLGDFFPKKGVIWRIKHFPRYQKGTYKKVLFLYIKAILSEIIT